MEKRIQLFFTVLSLLLFTSCFEFVEEITFNNDGSGSAVLTLNLSKSKSKIASIMLLDSVNGYKVPSKTEIRNKVNEIVAKVKGTKGVHNVKNTLDFDEYIVTLSCDFDNVDVLNKVVSSFGSKKDVQIIQNHKHFSFNKEQNSFARSHHFNLSKEVAKAKVEDRKILDNATYTSVYRFASPIKTFKNKDAKVSKNKKAILLRLNVQDIITNKKTIKNFIQLEN